jgi:hypothetical protein
MFINAMLDCVSPICRYQFLAVFASSVMLTATATVAVARGGGGHCQLRTRGKTFALRRKVTVAERLAAPGGARAARAHSSCSTCTVNMPQVSHAPVGSDE